jgi:hypothetical protein
MYQYLYALFLSASSILLAHITYIYFNCVELGCAYSCFIKGANLLTSYATDFLSHILRCMTLVPETSMFIFFVIELLVITVGIFENFSIFYDFIFVVFLGT